jgi:hypothetical protein
MTDFLPDSFRQRTATGLVLLDDGDDDFADEMGDEPASASTEEPGCALRLLRLACAALVWPALFATLVRPVEVLALLAAAAVVVGVWRRQGGASW